MKRKVPNRPRAARVCAFLVIALLLSSCRGHSAAVAPLSETPAERSRQLVVVTTPNWNATSGSLWRFSRGSSGDAWHVDAGPLPVVVGRTGLAWGNGFDLEATSVTDPHKHEGDGRSPAGAFPLDTVFGYGARGDSQLQMPYVQLTSLTDCVDDTASVHYNTVVNRDAVPRVDWASAEQMRAVWQYETGVIVGYNAAPPSKGRGSCIFLHIWDGPASNTAGCTAFDRLELQRLIAWLDKRRQPVLVQLTADQYTAHRSRWHLPALP